MRWTVLPAAIPSISIVDVDQFSVFTKNVGDDSSAKASVLYIPAKKTSEPPRNPPVRSAWNFDLKVILLRDSRAYASLRGTTVTTMHCSLKRGPSMMEKSTQS